MAFSIQCLTVGPLQENCYVLADSDSHAAVLIDPGDEADKLLAALAKQDLQLQAIWLTHAHFDHVGALADILDKHDVPVWMHPADEVLLKNAAASAASWNVRIRQPDCATQPLSHGQCLEFAGLSFLCLYTPGHAPGHIAFYLESEKLVIAGDALFRGSIGRTDLPYGDHEQLLSSIRRELLSLPPETHIFPGHGPETSIAFEKEHNPFF